MVFLLLPYNSILSQTELQIYFGVLVPSACSCRFINIYIFSLWVSLMSRSIFIGRYIQATISCSSCSFSTFNVNWIGYLFPTPQYWLLQTLFWSLACFFFFLFPLAFNTFYLIYLTACYKTWPKYKSCWKLILLILLWSTMSYLWDLLAENIIFIWMFLLVYNYLEPLQ